MIAALFGSHASTPIVVLCFVIMPIAIGKYACFVVWTVRALRQEARDDHE